MFFNNIGGFSSDGREYVIRLTNNITTPMPWSNIVSNEEFGFLVTESGAGYTCMAIAGRINLHRGLMIRGPLVKQFIYEMKIQELFGLLLLDLSIVQENTS